ncbi:hypothetical protein BCON_0093g00100 [Botryotinia convoluta]|uniref:Uncharacterized protein n=1 Tax=Botryotinia convoluta TaxID=54673 RepID=A0A4Z1I147_9HELO|nr:hypothetical protein BCON_0093g00100 [Botryotinia convoluta]
MDEIGKSLSITAETPPLVLWLNKMTLMTNRLVDADVRDHRHPNPLWFTSQVNPLLFSSSDQDFIVGNPGVAYTPTVKLLLHFECSIKLSYPRLHG